MKNLLPYLYLALGGLIYQLGRFLLGMPPTWDTFIECTLFFWAMAAIVSCIARKFQ